MSAEVKKNLRIKGYLQLMTKATIEISHITEGIHQRIIQPPVLPTTRIQHVLASATAFTYENFRKGTQMLGKGLSKMIDYCPPALKGSKQANRPNSFYAALNGIIGDQLAKESNPLEILMSFSNGSHSIEPTEASIHANFQNVTGKLIILVHGSCMDETCWTRKEHNHGEVLAKELNQTAIYLRYNSGLHIHENGMQFSALIEELINNWPVPVEEINIVAHSMGGLVSRSAIYYGGIESNTWTTLVNKVIFLGTPHQGSKLEQIGNYIDNILESIPYLKPLARLAKIRSAGVTDLRHGNITGEDIKKEERFHIQGDQRLHVPLPATISFYAIAGVISKRNSSISAKTVGDGLVDINSALGRHRKAKRILGFKEENIWIEQGCNHGDLLSNTTVYSKMKYWFEN